MKKIKIISSVAILYLTLVSPVAYGGIDYKIVYNNGDKYYVAIDILSDLDALSATFKEPLYKNITREICLNNDCVVKFWIDESLAPTVEEMTPKQKKGMVAEYQIKNNELKLIYHCEISHIDNDVAESSCVKEVFNKYCLGGTKESLPTALSSKKDGDLETFYYADYIVVDVFKNKIAKVKRLYQDMTWLKYYSLKSKLEDIYGSPRDLSFYPSYSSTSEDRETSINIGKGKAVHLWEQAGWAVELSWFEYSALLEYEHEKLSEAIEYAGPQEGF